MKTVNHTNLVLFSQLLFLIFCPSKVSPQNMVADSLSQLLPSAQTLKDSIDFVV